MQIPALDEAGSDREAIGKHQWIGMKVPSWIIEFEDAAPLVDMRWDFPKRDAVDKWPQTPSVMRYGFFIAYRCRQCFIQGG
jgi:hypothetical protein